MAASALSFARDNLAGRQAFALTLSTLLHGGFLLAVMLLPTIEPPPPPLEISIFSGPPGPASPPPGEKSMEPGPLGPPPAKVEPAPREAPAPKVKAAPKPQPKVAKKPVARPKPAPAPPRVEDQGLLGALRKSKPTTSASTRAFEGVASDVQLRERPVEGETSSGAPALGAPRARAQAEVGTDVVPSESAVSGSLGSGVGSVVLPGPGGGGSGWGGGGEGAGGGGTGRGGFSVSGAGAGGTGRSYSSIWNHTQRYLAGLRWAYNNELRRNPALRGVIVVRYEILASGAVGQVTMVSSGLKHPGLEQEVLRQIRGWRYPPEPRGSVLVTWPFSFVPPSG